MKQPSFFLIVILLFAGFFAPAVSAGELYFPPASGEDWEQTPPETLGWNAPLLNDLFSFLEMHHAKSFLILKGGKIVAERYWDPAGQAYSQQVFSVGKSITAFLIGIAQEQGKLKITQAVSEFLGNGWTKASKAQEKAIRIQHLLKMTSGLTTKLTFYKTPDTLWYYNTDAYHQLHPLLEKATGKKMQQYGNSVLFNLTGMKNTHFLNHTFKMTARDMARFGLMILAGCSWNGQKIMNDSTFFQAMLTTSQNLNKSYGYLWWLNGKESFFAPDPRVPLTEGSLIPDAPEDLICAMGKSDQRIYIVPSQNLIVIRQGDSAAEGEDADAISTFDNSLWQKIMAVLPSGSSSTGNADPNLVQPTFTGSDGVAYFDEAQQIPCWLHPEIRIFSAQGNIDVTDIGINQNGKYYVRVKVHNQGPQAAENVTVTGLYCEYGVTSDFLPFGKPFTIPSIAPGETVEAKIQAISSIAGHVCVKAEIVCANDTNVANNQGQRNLWIEAATPGRTITRDMVVVNRALIKQDGGRWKIGPVPQLRLHSRVLISPASMNTPQNQSLVRVDLDPNQLTFADTTRVSRQKANIRINFDRKLPRGIEVHVLVRPVSPNGKLLMDGCSWKFNVTKLGTFQSDGGM